MRILLEIDTEGVKSVPSMPSAMPEPERSNFSGSVFAGTRVGKVRTGGAVGPSHRNRTASTRSAVASASGTEALGESRQSGQEVETLKGQASARRADRHGGRRVARELRVHRVRETQLCDTLDAVA